MTEKLLQEIGFRRRMDLSHPVMRFFEIEKNRLVVMVQIFPDNKWSAFISIRDGKESMSRHIQGITEAIDLKTLIELL
jgi:hypothetical protein